MRLVLILLGVRICRLTFCCQRLKCSASRVVLLESSEAGMPLANSVCHLANSLALLNNSLMLRLMRADVECICLHGHFIALVAGAARLSTPRLVRHAYLLIGWVIGGSYSMLTFCLTPMLIHTNETQMRRSPCRRTITRHKRKGRSTRASMQGR
jgi:hypothetical protein